MGSVTSPLAPARAQGGRDRSLVRLGGQALVYALLVFLTLMFLGPLYWLVTSALKSPDQLSVTPPQWIPQPVQWGNITDAWNAAPFGQYLINTLTISIPATIGAVLCSAMAGYGFARLRFPGRTILFSVLLATMMLPDVVTLIPTFVLFHALGWINTFKPLIVPSFFGGGGGAFYIFLMRQAYRGIPRELSEAATVDGAPEWRIFAQVVVPLVKPAVGTVAIFAFVARWNDFAGPLIYLTNDKLWTLALGLQNFVEEHTTNWSYLMSISLVMMLPILVIFLAAQRYFIQGIALTGGKG
jgi:multiple sugar transport system permease protein